MSDDAAYLRATTIDLAEGWRVRQIGGEHGFDADVPFDVHSRLLAEGAIPDPYHRDNETALDWVHEAEWAATRSFDLEDPVGRWTLALDRLDGIAEVRVNDHLVGACESAFVRHDLDITPALTVGRNTIEIRFASASAEAARRAAALPFAIPYVDWNCRIPHVNLLRKSQCDAGWDWNIALMPLGLYGNAVLKRRDGPAAARWDDLKIVQRHGAGSVRVEATACVSALDIGEIEVALSLCGETQIRTMRLLPGDNALTLAVEVADPDLWWPVGQGPQTLHDLAFRVGDERRTRRIGLREAELVSEPDAIGRSFGFRVNGRDVYAQGANWIPADALPERRTPDVVRRLLLSALDANMTMIRVWGGGVYEPDWFYDICDELGLMVWQDFMFACHQFPAFDEDWLALVRTEARQQVRRLSSHASLIVWCGDNELVPALEWWQETREDRDRYLANYLRLNDALRQVHAAECVDTPFWSSSPSRGPLDFGHDWYRDDAGDMHFWAVWHGEGDEAGDFERFRRIAPRFCSEFGFQSFPTMPCIARFADPSDRAFDSAVMEVHQRNGGGNAKILDTMARHFIVPDGFEERVFLSQVQQAMAIRIAVEGWRAAKPRCQGTLYWQLNDTWPVASWSGLDHGGAWKVLHYAARRFHAPILVTAVPDEATDSVALVAVCDVPGGVSLTLGASLVHFDGRSETLGSWSAPVPTDAAVTLTHIPRGALKDAAFIHLVWRDAEGRVEGESDYVVPETFARYSPPDATIVREWGVVDGLPALTLETDAPAFFVTVGLGRDAIWSDNAMTLLPGRPRTIVARRMASGADPASLDRSAMDICHLGAPRE